MSEVRGCFVARGRSSQAQRFSRCGACCCGVSCNRKADLGGTKLGPRMGVGTLGLLRIPLLLGSAFLSRLQLCQSLT